jgi:hypothetical protein
MCRFLPLEYQGLLNPKPEYQELQSASPEFERNIPTAGTLDIVESWAPGESEWREEESMPTARHSHCAVEMMDRMYLMGGHDGEQVTDTVSSQKHS